MKATKEDYLKAKIAMISGILLDNIIKDIEFNNENGELKEIKIILK